MSEWFLAMKMREYEIPVKARGLRFADLRRGSAADEAAIHVAEEFVVNIRDFYVSNVRPMDQYPVDRSTIGKGLFLVGPPGTGKSTLAAVTLIELLHQHPVLCASSRLRFLAMADLFSMKFEQMSLEPEVKRGTGGASERFWEIQSSLNDAREAAVLVLDDVEKESKTNSRFVEAEVDRLLRQRHRAARPTIVTTNANRDDWGTIYGSSMRSFLDEAFTLVPMLDTKNRAQAA